VSDLDVTMTRDLLFVRSRPGPDDGCGASEIVADTGFRDPVHGTRNRAAIKLARATDALTRPLLGAALSAFCLPVTVFGRQDAQVRVTSGPPSRLRIATALLRREPVSIEAGHGDTTLTLRRNVIPPR
jgi:hypothetical protein